MTSDVMDPEVAAGLFDESPRLRITGPTLIRTPDSVTGWLVVEIDGPPLYDNLLERGKVLAAERDALYAAEQPKPQPAPNPPQTPPPPPKPVQPV